MKLEPSTFILWLSYVLLHALSLLFGLALVVIVFLLLYCLVIAKNKHLSSDVELLVAESFWQLLAYFRGSAKLWLEFGLMEIRYFNGASYLPHLFNHKGCKCHKMNHN